MALGGRPQNQELDAWRQEKADLLKKMNEETRAMSAAMAPRHSEKLRMLARDHEYLDELDGLDEKERPRAKEVLGEEERKVAVRLGLCAAVDANNVDALRVTIKEGLAAGLGSEDLEEAMEALERKVAWGPLTCIRMLAHDPRPSSPRPSSPRPGIRGPRGGYGGSGAQDGLGASTHPRPSSPRPSNEASGRSGAGRERTRSAAAIERPRPSMHPRLRGPHPPPCAPPRHPDGRVESRRYVDQLATCAGKRWWFYQLTIAAGGSISGQVFFPGTPDREARGGNCLGLVVVLHTVEFTTMAPESVDRYKRTPAELLGPDCPWEVKDDALVAKQVLLGGPSTQVLSINIAELQYEYLHEDYNHLTVTAQTQIALIAPKSATRRVTAKAKAKSLAQSGFMNGYRKRPAPSDATNASGRSDGS